MYMLNNVKALVKVFFLDSIQNPGNYLDHLLLSALACESSEDVAVQVVIGWLSGWLCESLNGCHWLGNMWHTSRIWSHMESEQ